jgi:NADPH:quinone reductase-like Zn-dependent oxidoreductase
MKAIVCTEYGPPEVLQFQEVDTPVPENNQVRVQVFATSVHRGDSRMRGLDIPGPAWQRLMARLVLGIRRPKNAILGMDLAGRIDAVGSDVTRFQPGDEVFGSTMWSGFGAYAEYKCMAEDGLLAPKPANMTFEEAAVIPSGGITALGIVKMAEIQPGQKVLIYGASGSVGSLSVQLARTFGAEVTGVCSTDNLDMVRALGAETAIDYTREDCVERGETYDVIFDAVDKYQGDYRAALKDTGIYLNVHVASDKIDVNDMPSLLAELKELAEAGKLKAAIDRRYPWEQIVEAHRYVDQGHKKGNVAITVVPEGQRG